MSNTSHGSERVGQCTVRSQGSLTLTPHLLLKEPEKHCFHDDGPT